jgi:amino acid transporter
MASSEGTTPVLSTPSTPETPPRLRRVLGLWDLVFYGIVLIQPIAPIPPYGDAQRLSDGHFVTIILITMFAMMITAVSYGRMAALYPVAGSAYTYVGRGLNPHLGFFAGWAMVLDYLLQPIINTVFISLTVHRYTPSIPYWVWAVIVAVIITLLNLAGIRASAAANKYLLFSMFAVVGAFIVLAIRFLYHRQGVSGLFSTEPFYNPATFHAGKMLPAISFAALTYIGFDGITTLSEDAKNPKRNILLATVLVCLFTGIFGGFLVYLGQMVWPDWHKFVDSSVTAFIDISRLVGQEWLAIGMGAILIVAAFGSALTGGLGAARLLFGMGRDKVLPHKFFGYLSKRNATPTYNILAIGGLSLVFAIWLNYNGNAYEHAAEMLNFGAFLAFMGVNLATFWQFAVTKRPGYTRRPFVDGVLPICGFIFIFVFWWNLPIQAWKFGGIWLVLGVVYAAIKTRGFRSAPIMIDFTES